MLANLIKCQLKSSNLVVEGRPERRGEDGVVFDLLTGGVTVTSPQVAGELSLDVLQTMGHLDLAQVTRVLLVFVGVPLQVERVETVAVFQYSVEQTESLALLKYINKVRMEIKSDLACSCVTRYQ